MCMKIRKCCFWIFIWVLSNSVISCSQQNETEQGGEAESCPVGPEPSVAEEVDTLNIIIETSGSMAGFMPSRGGEQTDFQMIVDNILANAESLEGNAIPNIRYWSAREKMYKEVYSRFSQMLRRGLRNPGSSSPIPQMLKNVSESFTGPDQVSIFISDFIYSPPDSRDRDFIANDIRRAISRVRQENFVVSVFASQSDFAGTFYPAERSSKPIRNCCSTAIPYYIWVMGPEEKVRLINREVIKDNYMEQVHFGFSPLSPAFMIIPGSGRSGDWYPADREGKVVRLDNAGDIREGGVMYTVGINLENLPGHVAKTEYLEDNFRLRVVNGEAAISRIYDRTQFLNQENINNKDRRLTECFSHYVTVSVTEVFDRNKNMEVNLVLGNELPGWIEAYTTEADSRIEEEGARTFSLNAVMEGAWRATGSQKGEFFNLNTTVDLSR